MQISLYREDGAQSSIIINKSPNECPICHYSINPNYITGFLDSKKPDSDKYIQCVFVCSREECHRLFIGYYSNESTLVSVEPIEKNEKIFSDSIKKISPDFIKIYNQAFSAEQYNLLEICGVGYRKAIEFLIKDYLVIDLDDVEAIASIKKKLLGDCIKQDVNDERIKEVAKRAVWIGNDEAHYEKKWEGKELKDLKSLIDLTVHWIDMNQLTKDIINDMP